MSRRWVILKEYFPHTVVYLHYRNDRRKPGRSWRIRDCSEGQRRVYAPEHLGNLTHDELLGRAFVLDDPAPADRPETDRWWYEETTRLNERYAHQLHPPPAPEQRSIPIFEEAELLERRGGKALERMLTSPRSEDWVTWTVFGLLPRVEDWWPRLLELADLDLPVDDVPKVDFWLRVPSPRTYEAALRARMRNSKDAGVRARAADPRAVEGPTEVDLVLEGESYLWFVEAKLGSDLSPDTTHDRDRDQLVRNIDVLLDSCGSRRAVMSLAVLDRHPGHLHTQLVERYRDDPAKLQALLRHRDRATINAVARDLRVLTWSDLLPLLPDDAPPPLVAELRRRVVR